jgi:hypothetical protein
MKHLNGKGHDHQPKSYDLAVQMLGILVLDCDAEKAKKNNDRAYANGHQPRRARNLPTVGPDQLGQPQAGEEPGQIPDGASHGSPTNPPKIFEGITDPSVSFGQHSPTTVAALIPRESSASSSSLAVSQPDPGEVQQGSRRQLTTTHGDPGSARERQPHLDLSVLAAEALAVAVPSGRDAEFRDTIPLSRPFPAHPGAARLSSSVPAQPSTPPFSPAHTRVSLPPLNGVFGGVGQLRASERDLSPGTSLPTFDSLTDLGGCEEGVRESLRAGVRV